VWWDIAHVEFEVGSLKFEVQKPQISVLHFGA